MLNFLFISLVSASKLTLLVDINDQEGLQYLSKFQPYYEAFTKSGLQFEVVHHLLPCYTCQQRHNFTQKEQNCYGGGRYCQYSDHNSGQLLLFEILRQNCLWEYDKTLYFYYIKHFSKQCIDSWHYTFCSEDFFSLHHINTIQLTECIYNSFEGKKDIQLDKNIVLENYLQKNNESQLTLFFDNQKLQKTSFNSIIHQLCQFIDNPPEFCFIIQRQLEANITIQKDQFDINMLIWSITLGVLIILAFKLLIQQILTNKNNQIIINSEEIIRIVNQTEESQI